MCGIAGYSGATRGSLLHEMTECIRYRGPDEEGFFENERIHLGHRRLSIIDLTSGQQPMKSNDGNLTLVFNGEIYNFQELKKTYFGDVRFTTTSDTEVLLYMYEKFGEKMFSYLNGMFALALWDEHKGILILARDRAGKKPLYYMVQNNELFFASEPKALLKAMHHKPTIDMMALRLYLQFQFVPSHRSIFADVDKLLPGHYAKWSRNALSVASYWKPTYSERGIGSIEKLDALLSDAVKIRLLADVPLGIFLSGGLDSSTITYYATKHSATKIKTFSIGFEEASFDETKYFSLVARHLDTDHHHQIFSSRDMLDVLPTIFDQLDEPLADASILPTYLLSKFTRQQVTVALGGDGADELFAGYPTFLAHKIAAVYSHIPSAVHNILSRLLSELPVSHKNISFDFKIKQFLKGAMRKGYERDIQWTAAFTLDEQEALLNCQGKDMPQSVSEIEEFFGRPQDAIGSILRFWQSGYLVDDILTKVDRASMYNSLEVRAPFLDYRIVEYVNSLRYRDKLNGFTSKYLLKQLMHDKLPSEIVHRQKKGFGIPLSKWLVDDLNDIVDDSLSGSRLNAIGIFNINYVKQLVEEHRQRKADHRMKLWTLIMLMQWHQRWIEGL